MLEPALVKCKYLQIVLCYIMYPPKSYVDRAWSAYDAGDVIMILCTAWHKYTIHMYILDNF